MNIISVKLRCLHLTFSLVILVRGVGGASCPGWFILPLAQDLGQTVSSVNSYCTIILEYLVVWDINIISVQLKYVYIQCSVWLSLSEGWGASCPGWFILPPAQDLGQAVSSVNSYCTIILEYLVVRDINIISVKLNLGIFSCKRCEHYFSQTEMFTSIVQFGYPCPRGWGASCPGWFILPPCPGFGSNSVISQFLLHHNLGIFSCKRCEHYFRQTEMFTSNVQFGYPCPRGGGQAVQAGLSCPPSRIWVKQCHQSILIAL